MKRFLSFLVFAVGAFAQSISVTAPSSGSPVLMPTSTGGWQYPLTASTSSIANLAYCHWFVDGESVGYAASTDGATCPPFVYNTYTTANGLQNFVVSALSWVDVANGTCTAISAGSCSPSEAPSGGTGAYVENWLPQSQIAFNATPSNAAGDLIVSVAFGATMSFSGGTPGSYLTNAVSFKPSGSFALVSGSNTATYFQGTSNALTTTTNDLLVEAVRWQSGSGTLSCTDSASDTFSYSQAASAGSGGYSSGICYAIVTGHSNNVVTASTSNSATVLTIHQSEWSGIQTSSPKDVDVTSSGGGVNLLSGAISPAAANELVIAFGTWNTAATGVQAGPGYTELSADSGIAAMDEYGSFSQVGSTWLGTMLLSFTNNNNTPVSAQCFVDGLTGGVNVNGVAGCGINTTLYPNVTHQIVAVTHNGSQGASGTEGCPGCSNGIWDYVGEYETTATFANGSTVSQLLASVHDQPLCTTAQTGPPSCPTSITLSGTWLKTDGTTTTATLASTPCSGNGTPVTLSSQSSSGCTVTQNAAGATSVTLTDSLGNTATAYFEVFTSPGYNILPHFGTDGLHTSYNAAHSIILRDLFYGMGGLSPILQGPLSSATCNVTVPTGSINSQYGTLFGNLFKGYGFNSMETAAPCLPSAGTVQSTWQTNATSDISAQCSLAATYGAGIYLYYGNWISPGYGGTGSPGRAFTDGGPATGWTPLSAMQYVSNGYAGNAGCALGSYGQDEINGDYYPNNPIQGLTTGGLKLGTSGNGQTVGSTLTCTSGTCTISMSQDPLDYEVGVIVTGSGNSTLDYNTSSGCAAAYSASWTGGTLTFTGVGSLTATFTAAGYPNLKIEPYANDPGPLDSTGVGNPSSSGPCTIYAKYSLLSDIYTAVNSQSGHWPITYAPTGSVGNAYYQYWSNSSISNYNADVYYSGVGYFYLPTGYSLGGLYAGQIATLRSRMSVMDLTKPANVEASGIHGNAANHGYPIAVASCGGNTITTSTDHLIRNISVVTRPTVTGSSSCNGSYFVIAAPTSTTLTVALASATGTYTGTGATLTWQDGTTSTNVRVTTVSGNGLTLNQLNLTNCTGTNNVTSKRGQTFTISGSSSSSLNGMTGWLDWATPDLCTAATNFDNYWLQIPSISASTGGTAYIQADNQAIPGRDWMALTSASARPRSIFASHTGPSVVGFPATKGYGDGATNAGGGVTDPCLATDRTSTSGTSLNNNITGGGNTLLWNDAVLSDFQIAWSLLSDCNQSQPYALAVANAQLVQAVDKQFILQPRAAAPDCGIEGQGSFECGVREDSSGDIILMIQSYVDNVTSFTVNLSPYLISGKTILKRVADSRHIQVTTLSAGTTSDTTTCQPGCYIAYVFGVNGAISLINQPSINYAFPTGATQAVVTWEYGCVVGQNCYGLSPQAPVDGVLPNAFVCSSMPCTPPWDRNIGPISFTIHNLTSGGVPKSTGAGNNF